VYVRGRQLEESFNRDPYIGIWPITGMRVQYGLGNVPLTDWPCITSVNEWPPNDRPHLDAVAKNRRISFYQRIRNTLECKRAICAYQGVLAAFQITDQWFNASGGRIEMPSSNYPVTDKSHAVAITGYDDISQRFHFANSWGPEWGAAGDGTLPYEYFESQMVSAWMLSVVDRPIIEQVGNESVEILNMGFASPVGGQVHVMECYDYDEDERIGWAIGVQREATMDIEDVFVRPPYRGNGYGRVLFELIREFQHEMNVRVWFSHADSVGAIQRRLCKSLKLNIEPTGCRWSRYVAQIGSSAALNVPPLIRPQMWWHSN
jgi:GNAT superfamily N-acetyltransferase